MIGQPHFRLSDMTSLRSDHWFWYQMSQRRKIMEDEEADEVAFFSPKRWDRRNSAELIESTTPCHDAQVVGPCRNSNPLHLTGLAAMSEDYTTAPRHLQIWFTIHCGIILYSIIKGSVSSSMPCTCRLLICLCCRHFHGPWKWRQTKASQETTRARNAGWNRAFKHTNSRLVL